MVYENEIISAIIIMLVYICISVFFKIYDGKKLRNLCRDVSSLLVADTPFQILWKVYEYAIDNDKIDVKADKKLIDFIHAKFQGVTRLTENMVKFQGCRFAQPETRRIDGLENHPVLRI